MSTSGEWVKKKELLEKVADLEEQIKVLKVKLREQTETTHRLYDELGAEMAKPKIGGPGISPLEKYSNSHS